MGKRRKKNKFFKKVKFALGAVLLVIAFLMYKCYDKPTQDYDIPEGSAQFHFIDIGQGDASLILVDDKAILIDTGDRASEDREKLTSYLEKLNITQLEYFIATHPDSDHIGSAAYVVENYDIKNVILSPKEHTSQVYENFISALEEREHINVINAQEKLGQSLFVGELEMQILGPIGEYESGDNNNPSVVIMARWGKTKVLLTGDAEKEAENRILGQYKDILDCDVLKVGHHGSKTSSQRSFLKYAKPEYAIISCGVDNKYDHPDSIVLDFLQEYGAKIYRTDTQGSIVVSTDGEKIDINTEK